MTDYYTCAELINKAIQAFKPDVKLSESLDLYTLRVADKNGDPDLDFPKIDKAQKILAIGMMNFALVIDRAAYPQESASQPADLQK